MPYIDSTPNNTLVQALRYASMGYKVIPVKWGKKVPACDHGVKDATSDPEQINQWFESSEGSQLNIGLSCEGLLVIDLDFDKKSTKTHDELKADLHAAARIYNDQKCPLQETRSGGMHFIYQVPSELVDTLKNITKVAKHGDIGIDLRTTGGYIIVPPSYVKDDTGSAGRYRWSVKRPLIPKDKLPFPPKNVCDLLRQEVANKKAKPTLSPVDNNDGKNDNGYTSPSHNKYSTDVQCIKQAASGREKDILRDVAGISEEYLDGKHHPCPKCCGEDRFRWMNEREDKPVFCNQCFYEKNGDVIAAVQWMCEISFPEALKRISDYLGLNFLSGKTETDKHGKRRAIVTPFNKIIKQKTEWLWDNKIPAGELCLLAGLPGQGKTFWTCYLAAMVSNGGEWPDDTPCPKGNVLFFRGEDSPEKTMRCRLEANGADLNNVHLFEGLTDGSILTLRCSDEIRDGIAQARARNGLPVRLIIIDPMADYLGDTKENSNCEVRTLLKPLKSISEETGATFLLIQHIGKADRENMQQRVIGSTGIVAACRASFCLFNDKKAGRRIFAPMKNNLAVEPTSVVFTIESTVDGGQVHITDCQYEKNADDIANEMKEAYKKGEVGQKSPKLENGKNWLKDFLSDGRKPAGSENNLSPGNVLFESRCAGHSWATIRRAKDELKIGAMKDGNVWYWFLLDGPDSPEQVAQNTISESQVAQNSLPATDGKEQQTNNPDGNSGQLVQNPPYTQNSEQVEHVEVSKPESLPPAPDLRNDDPNNRKNDQCDDQDDEVDFGALLQSLPISV